MAGLQSAAQQLQSYGRGKDTLLAHISPDEAAFIDQIQGGRRTNPMTGLPEYSLFGKILKTVARVGATIGGFVYGGPLGAAAANAAVTKLTGGTWKQALKSGAISGLTAGVGQGLTTGISSIGSIPANAAASGAASAGAGAAAPAAAGSGATIGASPGFYSGLSNVGSMASIAPSTISSASAPAFGGGLGASLGSTAATTGFSSLAPAAAAVMPAATAAAPGSLGALFPSAAAGLSSAGTAIGGTPGFMVGLGALNDPTRGGEEDEGIPDPPPGYGASMNLNVAPMNRVLRPYTGDPAKLGQQAGGYQFFDNVNPNPVYLAEGGKVGPLGKPERHATLRSFDEMIAQKNEEIRRTANPFKAHALTKELHDLFDAKDAYTQQQFYDPDVQGMVSQKSEYAQGGGVMGPRQPGGGIGLLGRLPSPGVPSQIQSPMMGAQQPRSDMSPAGQRMQLRQAAMLGYVNAKDGGAISGPGTGTSDSVPAMLSDGEHVVDEATVRAAGHGSIERGHKAIERFKRHARAGAGMRNPSKPPAFGGR